ncbi:DUF975 family protein [Ligilactobacillus sp. WILCCON 0076]|uniref:DUF975 family protein n=1 Tax=Ligilactobacillus ubinensis TaxID=2876789 RepID=A0A9X2JNV2_9LACO|nr:DUF975 family protein [Ligilactobacillus ubinensis]MCP0887596.1 DUF975 family protein [Ligilactobacillus ubinensis]
MKTRKEMKREVRQTFKGRWGKAINLTLLESIPMIIASIGLTAVIGLIFKLLMSDVSSTGNFVHTIADNNSQGSSGLNFTVNTGVTIIATLIVTGISFTFLDWLRTKDSSFSVIKGMFSVFSKEYFVGCLVLYIIQYIFTILWTLLFIIPGIIKRYSYSQTYFIYKDCVTSGRSEDMNYLDYVTESRKLMDGHKIELFVLQLSLLGWAILSVLTLGIGFLWFIPYKSAVYAEFYRGLAEDKFTSTVFNTNN